MVAGSSSKWLPMLVFVALAAAFPRPASAVDSRLEKARRIREEILLKRREIEERSQPPADEDPFEAAVRAARDRVADLDAQIAERQRRSQDMAAPREKLQASSEELAADVARVQQQNRARVEAVYRSARLGTGAAGWHAEPSRGVRLSRYLAAIARVQQARLEVVEIEHGSVIASLDRERAAEAAAAAELRVLQADRAEAEARLQQAIAEAAPGGAPGPGGFTAGEVSPADRVEADATGPDDVPAGDVAPIEDLVPVDDLADDPTHAGVAANDGEDVEREAAGADQPPVSDEALLAAARGEPLPGESADEDSAMAVHRALAKLAEHNARKAAEAEASPPPADARATDSAEDDAADPATADATDPAKADGAEAGASASAATGASDGEFTWTGDAAEKGQAAADGAGASGPDSGAATAEPRPVENPEAGATDAQDETAAPGEAPKTAEQPEPRRRGLLSRIFGSDREADAFASSRGEMPPPVPGKVVANYGQQHKSGATYRGVILRAAHSDPVRAVSGGKVSFVGEVPGLGNTVIVSHGGRYHTVYARLGSLDVKEGDSVSGGTRLGELPDDNADLHFELRDGGKAIDPLPWLRGVPGAAPQ